MYIGNKYLRLIILVIFAILCATSVHARSARRVGVLVGEPDGNPDDQYAYKILTSNGTLSVTNNIATITVPSSTSPTFTTDITIQGTSGNQALMYFTADAGEDNADKFRIYAQDSGSLVFDSFESGSWLPFYETNPTTGLIIYGKDDTDPAQLYFFADQATDNDDEWRINVNDGGTLDIETFQSGGWVDVLTLSNTGALGGIASITTTSNITSGDSFIIGAADIEEAELEILDGATLSTTDINIIDGIGDSGTLTATELLYVDGVTSAIQTQIDTKAAGAASSTDNAIARYDSTTGKVLQNSGVTIDDSNNITIPGSVTVGTSTGTFSSSAQVITISATGGTYNENITIDLDNVSNQVDIGSGTGVTTIDFGSLQLNTTGIIKGRAEYGTDVTTSTNHDTTELHGVFYHFTAAATVTLDAAADAGYGAQACYRARDDAEAYVIDLVGTEKINLDGTALAAGTAITTSTQGSTVCLVATTDTDGSGTDGWETWGNNGWASE